MRRPLHLATAALAALTAVTLLAAAVAIRPPGLPAEAGGPDNAANRRVILRYYAAVNGAIATGDLDPLAAIVAPNLLDDRRDEPSGREQIGLRRRLIALRATNPDLQLTVEDLAIEGDLAIARVGVVGGAAPASTTAATSTVAPAFLGLPVIESPAPWSPIDVLRMADGRIVAHGDGHTETGLLEPAAAGQFDLPAGRSGVVTVHRLTVAAGAEHVARAVAGSRLLYVETGAPTITVVADGLDGRAGPLSATPEAGEHLTIWSRARYTIRNDGETPVVLIDVFTDPPAYQAAQPPDVMRPIAEPGIGMLLLAGGLTTATPRGSAVLSIGRATLAPGAHLAWDRTAGPVLLYVEAGTAIPSGGAGDAWVRGGSGRYRVLGDDALTTGDGAIVKADHRAAFRAGSQTPTSLLIVTLLPAGDQPT